MTAAVRKLELLAPAKNLECGRAAIDSGADAVYIGAERLGARAAAGNSVADIGELCRYAHGFGAKVYAAVNTIVYDGELAAAEDLVGSLAAAGVDAVIVQDMAVAEMVLGLPGRPVALHASTQMDNRSADKVEWLAAAGFDRAVLARELSLTEIGDIHKALPGMELEVFVHGALCVAYSGLCYASQHCFGRSANRGECSQFCRMKFDLVDSEGREIAHQKHLLSLKDLCLAGGLEKLADAGAVSFKIEGRLKDADYVKNVVSAYSMELDGIVERRVGEYSRASLGVAERSFEPKLEKTFNRGYTTYFHNGRQQGICSPDTPKSIGERVGRVKEIRGGGVLVSSTASFANGDGLCFFNRARELVGFRVNRADGNRLFPHKMPKGIEVGTALYRNSDAAFAKLLAGKCSERRIPVTMLYTADGCHARLEVSLTDGSVSAVAETDGDFQVAEKPQAGNILRQVEKLGQSVFKCVKAELSPGSGGYFVPSSMLSGLRREALGKLAGAVSVKTFVGKDRGSDPANAKVWDGEYARHTHMYNVSNSMARAYYKGHGLDGLSPAYEMGGGRGAPVMQCKHCIKYSMGMCARHKGKRHEWKEPFSLRLADGRMFRLEFNCKDCQMNVYAE